MREIRQSGSEGREPHPNAASLPLSCVRGWTCIRYSAVPVVDFSVLGFPIRLIEPRARLDDLRGSVVHWFDLVLDCGKAKTTEPKPSFLR
jgi:hypothetical protein